MESLYPYLSKQRSLNSTETQPETISAQQHQQTASLALAIEDDRKENFICTKAAARLLGISNQTLEKWRSQNRGPRYVKIGGKSVRYKQSDLDAFVEEGFSNV